MSGPIDVTEFNKMVESAGLDFSNDADYGHWQQAISEYNGDDMTRDVTEIIAKAANKKKLASAGSLDDYFQTFREQERQKASKNTPKPQPKTNKTATDMLNDHFAEWRKKNLP